MKQKKKKKKKKKKRSKVRVVFLGFKPPNPENGNTKTVDPMHIIGSHLQ